MVGGLGGSIATPVGGVDLNITGVLIGTEMGTVVATGSPGVGANVGGEVFIGVIYGSVKDPTINVDVNVGAYAIDLYLTRRSLRPTSMLPRH